MNGRFAVVAAEQAKLYHLIYLPVITLREFPGVFITYLASDWLVCSKTTKSFHKYFQFLYLQLFHFATYCFL